MLRQLDFSSTAPAPSEDSAPRIVRAGRVQARRRRVEIRCADCGYGGVVWRLPERCPMCGGTAWQEGAARRQRPFAATR